MSAATEFFSELVGLEIALWDRLDSLQLASSGVSVAQLQGLQAVASRTGGARVNDLAGELQITVGAASKLVDRLERDGLATRTAHPTDRRSMIIRLTPAGEKARAEAAAAAERHLDELVSGAMTAKRMAELTAGLAALRSALDEPRS